MSAPESNTSAPICEFDALIAMLKLEPFLIAGKGEKYGRMVYGLLVAVNGSDESGYSSGGSGYTDDIKKMSVSLTEARNALTQAASLKSFLEENNMMNSRKMQYENDPENNEYFRKFLVVRSVFTQLPRFEVTLEKILRCCYQSGLHDHDKEKLYASVNKDLEEAGFPRCGTRSEVSAAKF